ncbi:hypothetical protein BGZ60DRAFT_535619 [Tricladium varicosporioides]|nr:hypothetical protein BGZ60DRAFT_535619 [Hymenoscyphus varicosporioides]
MYKSLILTALCSLAAACAPPQNATEGYPRFTQGSDGPADSATLGYQINHIGFVVSNLTATRLFYGEVLGMRHIFTFETTPAYTVMYMGHPQGGKNGTGFQCGEELFAEKNNMQGLMEFIQLKDSPPQNRTNNPLDDTQTFSHIGLVVPDLQSLQRRVESFNATILKRIDDPPARDQGSIVAHALGFSDPTGKLASDALPAIQLMGFFSFLIFADPDGNVIEAQQQISSGV